MMINILKKFERVVIGAVILMLALVVFFATVELGFIIIKDLATPPLFIIEIHQLLKLFGLFLLILIGIELLETIKKYYAEGKVDLHVIIGVALIALARKIITIDPKDYDPLTLVGIASMVLALAAAFWVVKKSNRVTHDA